MDRFAQLSESCRKDQAQDKSNFIWQQCRDEILSGVTTTIAKLGPKGAGQSKVIQIAQQCTTARLHGAMFGSKAFGFAFRHAIIKGIMI